eukprot:CAMPEP_0196588238 /NCGR_PEP_ID=MMETSP1081-20130531/59942_1 /TAXON_ID=36882 /ORGANISM="Pyramimonas amylifera, Strain CCMP720" /LENGTH=399 /DNA_ID=CAMNT_0041910683 /DNA_START=314 /DNA_END=1513 /DNA_ORIENTATION=-
MADLTTPQVAVGHKEVGVGSFSAVTSFAHYGLVVLTVLPLILNLNENFNIVATATLAIIAGSFRSLKAGEGGAQETMTQKDAMRFPLLGSCVLFGLFVIFKLLPKDLVNLCLSAYFSLLGVLALSATLLPFSLVLFSAKRQEHSISMGNFRVPYLMTESVHVSLSAPEILCGAVSVGFCLWYLTKKHWIANNVLGLAFSIQGIEFLSVGSIFIGCILLAGLFVYDIFWVFCTPVMVSVAKNFDAPIKLLFPRVASILGDSAASAAARPFSMLGLGDIVVPGIFVAILLRFDCQHQGGRSKGFFYAAIVGYVIGLVTTISVMHLFQAAQPALLYIVPSVFLSVLFQALVSGKSRALLDYDESTSPDGHAADEPENQKSDKPSADVVADSNTTNEKPKKNE